MPKQVFVFLLLTIFSLKIFSQNNNLTLQSNKDGHYGGLYFGIANSFTTQANDGNAAVGFNLLYKYQVSRNVFSIKAFQYNMFRLYLFGGGDFPSTSFSGIDILYGKDLLKSNKQSLIFSSGVSISRFINRGNFLYSTPSNSSGTLTYGNNYYERLVDLKLGIPIEITYRYYILHSKRLMYVFNFATNINSRKVISSFNFSFEYKFSRHSYR